MDSQPVFKPVVDTRDLGVILKEELGISQKALQTHQQQMAHHAEQADFHRKRVEYINKFINEQP